MSLWPCAWRSHAAPAQEYFASLDKDGDKFLSVKEYLAGAWLPTVAVGRNLACPTGVARGGA